MRSRASTVPYRSVRNFLTKITGTSTGTVPVPYRTVVSIRKFVYQILFTMYVQMYVGYNRMEYCTLRVYVEENLKVTYYLSLFDTNIRHLGCSRSLTIPFLYVHIYVRIQEQK